ncbi:MAG TPA: DUF4912 domain-containing protein [Pirellulaceae bacterium]|nr:DUF4912 domain-containing protein [Pirellulaceae bacterium]HMO91291.1 DUF4912 domain-containing protein [Pirellulaceae bacterium]HMP68525.1 DUF4912 domain-containing protein [Pirellulaceae bacterium]
MSPESLRSLRVRELAEMARKRGIVNWRSLRKEELVRELIKAPTKSIASKSKGLAKREVALKAKAKSSHQNVKLPNPTNPIRERERAIRKREKPQITSVHLVNQRVHKIIREQNQERQRVKNLARDFEEGQCASEGIVLIVRDAYWLQACWSIQPQTIERSQVALADEWYYAQPVIRLLSIQDHGSTHGVENIVRDIPIHGGVRNWYIDVTNPPGEFRVALGYLTASGRFYHIAKSNIVSTPHPGKSDLMKGHWDDIAENHQKYFALSGGYSEGRAAEELRDVFENQLQRPMHSPSVGHASSLSQQSSFKFEVNAEVHVFGTVDPRSKVTLAGDPVKVEPDGSFSVPIALPDRRHVLPVVALSRDGSQQRTIVLAIEKNTKIMEAINCDQDEP